MFYVHPLCYTKYICVYCINVNSVVCQVLCWSIVVIWIKQGSFVVLRMPRLLLVFCSLLLPWYIYFYRIRKKYIQCILNTHNFIILKSVDYLWQRASHIQVHFNDGLTTHSIIASISYCFHLYPTANYMWLSVGVATWRITLTLERISSAATWRLSRECPVCGPVW